MEDEWGGGGSETLVFLSAQCLKMGSLEQGREKVASGKALVSLSARHT
jgi:hypothetical protein